MTLTKHARAAAALVAAAALLAAGCGDDDDAATSPPASGSDDELSSAGAAPADSEFCGAAVAVDAAGIGLESGATTADDFEQALQAAEGSAPASISGAVAIMTTEARNLMAQGNANQSEDGPPIPSDEFFAASVDVGGYLSDNCGFETLDVTATNYRFDGIPETVPAGTTVLNFINDGTEFHEIHLAQLPVGEDRSVEQLLSLPEDQQPDTADTASVVAPPGTRTYVTAELDPGRYVALCFVPVGATLEAMQSGAPLNEEDSHLMHGMVAEFTVE
jgi:hypothetical protein